MANNHAPARDVTKWLRLSCLCLKNPMKQKMQQMEGGSILANLEVTSFMNGPLCGGHRLRSLGNFLSFQGLQCKNKPFFFCDIDHILQTPFGLIEIFEFWILKLFDLIWLALGPSKSIHQNSIAILGLSLSANTILGWVGQKLS